MGERERERGRERKRKIKNWLKSFERKLEQSRRIRFCLKKDYHCETEKERWREKETYVSCSYFKSV